MIYCKIYATMVCIYCAKSGNVFVLTSQIKMVRLGIRVILSHTQD